MDCVLHFVPLLLLGVGDLLAELDSPSLQYEGVLLAVAQVDVDPGWCLHCYKQRTSMRYSRDKDGGNVNIFQTVLI